MDGQRSIDWSGYDAVVFDLDGTLYDARKLRRAMLVALGLHLLRHPGEANLLRILQGFRHERERLAEEEATGIGRLQYERPARRLGVEPSRVEEAVRRWMHERPLPLLAECRYPGVAELFARLRRAGKRVAVFSDYPARDKIAALGLEAELVVSAEDPGVDRLKPQPAGLARVLAGLDVEASRCLLIGDRDERDGECARRLGVAHLIKVRGRPAGAGEFARYEDLLRGLA